MKKKSTILKSLLPDLVHMHLVEGEYVLSPSPSNDWHYVSISRQIGSQNVYIWKNKAGFEWDLIFLKEEGVGVLKFKVGENCPNKTFLYFKKGSENFF